MKCPKCETLNPDDSKYCKECAAPLTIVKDIAFTVTLKAPVVGFSKGTLIADKYKIVQKVGEGGMGIVYEARDTRLDRTVALKFLSADLTRDQEAKQRFVQEARAAAALNHPNITTIHEIDEYQGKTFIAMEFISGQSLKKRLGEGPLALDEAKGLAIQTAEGLKEAHDTGIVHRDIKPANIMLTGKGMAKITDFGLAKLSGEADLTKASTIMGTLAYMSPEQARGQKIDHRTDIWSLGCVFYEMLSGERPFKSTKDQALLYSVLNEEPALLSSLRSDIPADIVQVVNKTLIKDQNHRYQDIEDFVQDLKTAQVFRLELPKQEKSIVVLPFKNISPEQDTEYFSDGLTEEIITDLSKLKRLRVISSTSAMKLKQTKKPITTIGRELDVQYVLEGSVRKAGQNLRITAQLIDARNDTHVWAEKYRGTLDDVFDIQEKVSRSIVDEIKLKLTPAEEAGIGERGIENIQAYEYYLRARREIYNLTREGLDNALQYLIKGLDIVGENVLLYACMGNVYYQYWNYGVYTDLSNIQKTEECAHKVFELEADSKHGHFLLGLMQIFIDPPQALQHFKRVLSEDPYHPETLLWLSIYLVFQGQQKYADIFLERLTKVDPLNPIVRILPGNLHFYCGRWELALEELKKIFDADPDHFVAQFHYARALAYVDRLAEAFVITDDLEKKAGEMRAQLFRLYRYAFQGKKSEVQRSISQEFITWAQRDWMVSFWLSEIFALIHKNDQALDWLGQAVDLGFINYPFLDEYNPYFKSMRKGVRFQKLMEEIRPKWENFEL
jgi:serine/threonine protein kinase/tetratricopeptide (TPR) repeat protein